MRRNALDDVFSTLREVLAPGSQVAFDYWEPDAMEKPTMIRLQDHLASAYGYTNLEWNLFGDGYISGLRGFKRIESDDIAGLERRYSQTRLLQGDNKIPGCYAVLRRED
jgi:hypothetical protein